MKTRVEEVVAVAAEGAEQVLGLLPHLLPLAAAHGPGGLEARLRRLVALAVFRSRGRVPCASVHRNLRRTDGLTEAELAGDLTGLAPAELAAVALALGTVSRPDPSLGAAPADEHFTSEQIEALRALALATEAGCQLHGLPRRVLAALGRRYSSTIASNSQRPATR